MTASKLRHARELADAGHLSMDEIAELVGSTGPPSTGTWPPGTRGPTVIYNPGGHDA
jgi:hypothetical protein